MLSLLFAICMIWFIGKFFIFGIKMNNIFPRDHSAAPLLEIRS